MILVWMVLRDVCGIDELESGSPRHAKVGDKDLILVKLDDGVYVLDGICTHEYAELWNGFVTDTQITCPLHLSQFDLKTGAVITPPAEEPLRVYKVEVRAGRVFVDV